MCGTLTHPRNACLSADGCNATAFLIGGSENRCNDTDNDSDGSSSVARVSHCNRPLRAGKVYTIQVQAVIAVPRIIVTSLAVVEVPGDDQGKQPPSNGQVAPLIP